MGWFVLRRRSLHRFKRFSGLHHRRSSRWERDWRWRWRDEQQRRHERPKQNDTTNLETTKLLRKRHCRVDEPHQQFFINCTNKKTQLFMHHDTTFLITFKRHYDKEETSELIVQKKSCWLNFRQTWNEKSDKIEKWTERLLLDIKEEKFSFLVNIWWFLWYPTGSYLFGKQSLVRWKGLDKD